MSNTPRLIQSVSNTELYNRWSKVYDTDGNILQAVDDHLLPPILSQVAECLQSPFNSTITITELGAGTGRNTAKLFNPSLLSVPVSRINALDLSRGMLDVARERCSRAIESRASTTDYIPEIYFAEFDALNPINFPIVKSLEGTADLVVSTLVLEHLPTDVFFKTVKFLLKKGGGYLVVTNMHAEMGRKSQAGFVDEETGEKIRGDSFNYEVSEVLEEGAKWGFRLEGEVRERGVQEVDIGEGSLLGHRGRKWVGVMVWFGFLMRLDG